MAYDPYIYTRTDAWAVVHSPSGEQLIDGLDKSVAAGFAQILNGDEESGWKCVGNKTAKRVKILETLREAAQRLTK